MNNGTCSQNLDVTRIDGYETKNNYLHMFTYDRAPVFFVVYRPDMATKNSNCAIHHFDISGSFPIRRLRLNALERHVNSTLSLRLRDKK